MKIDSPKFAAAPRTAERPQLSTTTATPKSGNTGIVPTAAQPKTADTFEKTATSSTSSNTGIVPATPPKTQSISTYALPANLEPHRAEIDKYGERIAKMPSQVQGKAIEHATDSLYRDLGDIATRDELSKAVSDSVAYFSSRGTSSNDPQCFRVVYGTEPSSQPRGPAWDLGSNSGSPGTRDPRSSTTDFLRSIKRQPQQQQPEVTHQRFRRMSHWF